MTNIRTAKRFSLWAFALITVIAAADISPLHGLSVATFPLILLALALWAAGTILLIRGLMHLKQENPGRASLFWAVLFTAGFLPAGYGYMVLAGYARTRITVELTNRSGMELRAVTLYGAGEIFAEEDTLRRTSLAEGETLRYSINASSEPQRGGGKKGDIVLEFDTERGHVSRVVAGPFSVYPLNIQQRWEITVDSNYLVYE